MLGVETVVGTDHRQALSPLATRGSLALDFRAHPRAVACIAQFADTAPFDAVLGTDDETVELASAAALELGLPCNPLSAVRAARDKYLFRRAAQKSRVRAPWFAVLNARDEWNTAAETAPYPVVLKPRSLSGSRGVIRADTRGEFLRACDQIDAILSRGADRPASILIEEFIPGVEVAVEGLLRRGRLQVLAMIDKPDPLDGPYFEETIYVTPSHLPEAQQHDARAQVQAATLALGLREGAIHAEVRIGPKGSTVIEIAARSIGGHCGRMLVFGGATLEEMILRRALDLPGNDFVPDGGARGVMMVPIPGDGIFRRIDGVGAAREIAGVTDVVISAHIGAMLRPAPEGGRYLGFIFASGETPDQVVQSLKRSHAKLDILID